MMPSRADSSDHVGGSVSGPDGLALGIRWIAHYWLLAAVIPLVFFAFDAITTSAYPTKQAPNVSLSVQLGLKLGFYALWIIVPRIIWSSVAREAVLPAQDQARLLLRLLLTGAGLCATHLLVLTVLLRVMYSPPGWGVTDLVYSFGEVCLSNAAMWMMAFGIASAVVVYHIRSHSILEPVRKRLEVRQNGKAWSVPLVEVFWIKATGNYAELHTARGIMLIRRPLAQISAEIGDDKFIQSHRSALINARHVVAIKPQEGGSGYLVQLANGESAPLSRRNLVDFKQKLALVE